MDQEASDDENAINEPSYFCYKAYIKAAGYTIFIIYSVIGIRRLCDHVNGWLVLEQCVSCRPYEAKTTWILWSISELLLYGFAPLSALSALIHADLEWFFPTYAIRTLFPSFALIVPLTFTIFSYILYWFIDLIVDVQQVSDNLLDVEVWKRCIWSGALLIANIYSILIAVVVLQLIYYQHYMIIEQQVMRGGQQNLVGNDGRVQHHQNRRRQGQLVNAAGFLDNQEGLNNNNDNDQENIANV